MTLARKSRGNSRIYNGFARDSLWKQVEICTTRFRLRKEKSTVLKHSEHSGRRSNVKRFRIEDRVRKSHKVTIASSLALRRTKSIGALEHQLSLKEFGDQQRRSFEHCAIF